MMEAFVEMIDESPNVSYNMDGYNIVRGVKRMDEQIKKQPPVENITIQESEPVKVFEGLKNSAIITNPQLLDILDLNAEQLTYYLEDVILDNPFIELEYSIERKIPAFERYEGSEAIERAKQGSQSLDTYLFEQILMFRHTEIRDAMVKAIEHLDERGYLPYTYKELAKIINMPEIVTLDAMTLVKQLEPAGIGAYDLRESMMLQTEQDEHAPNVAYYLLEDFFTELTDQDYAEIQEQTNLSYDEIMECVNYYHTLRTNPAALFDQVDKINLIPDVTVMESGEGLQIRYNRQYYPKISFNQSYYDEMVAQRDAALNEYIEPKEEGYQRLADNLRIREQLILEVVMSMVQAHSDYFMHINEHTNSLSIRQIAKETRLPEPIVNMIATNKNIEFNGHVYAFTDFINVSTSITRDGLSANYIKDTINDIIDNSDKTLTDEEVRLILQDSKIIVGKHIIHNYRQNLGK
ncbi:RNA polymerase subunit sigma-54 [Aerococcaceae bacterium WGS1372]